MGCPIFSNNSGSIHRKSNGKVHPHNIMNDLVISSLHESRINCNNWAKPFKRQSTSIPYSMLFCHPNIKSAVGENLTKFANSGAVWHGCCNTYNFFIFFCQLNQSFSKYFGIWGRCVLTFFKFARSDIKRFRTVPHISLLFSYLVSFSFACNHMN